MSKKVILQVNLKEFETLVDALSRAADYYDNEAIASYKFNEKLSKYAHDCDCLREKLEKIVLDGAHKEN